MLGRKSEDGKGYQALPLSYDHNSREEREVARLAKAHPDEKDIVMCYHEKACYVKGKKPYVCLSVSGG